MIPNTSINKIHKALKQLVEQHMTTEVVSSSGKDIKLKMDHILHHEISKYLDENTDLKVYSEEDDANYDYSLEGGDYWLIDPLDGSFNYSKNSPLCCISIAQIKQRKPVLGLIYDFNRDLLYYAAVAENEFQLKNGAWVNNEPIKVSSTKTTKESVISTGFPSYRDYSEKSLMDFLTKVQKWKKVRLLGSAALSLAWLSVGAVDAYWEEDIRIWDVAAGMVLVEAAGGINNITINDRRNFVSLLSTNGQIELE